MTIRNIAWIGLALHLFILGGCSRGFKFITSSHPPTQHHGWEISAGPGKEIKIARILDGGGRSTTQRPEPQPGWFVAVLSENELWYFDGDQSLNLFLRKSGVITTYNHDNAPIPVPSVVQEALPPHCQITP